MDRESVSAIKNILNQGISIEEVAVSCGVSASTVYRWKEGRARPHKTFKKKLMDLQFTM